MTSLTRVLLASLSLGLASALSAGPLSFDFKDPKGVNNVQFHLDAPLESISGQGTGVTGSVSFDPAAPEATHGTINLATDSLTVGNPTMMEHMHGANWLDVAKYPEITFQVHALEHVQQNGAALKAQARGSLTLKGVAREVTVPVSISHLPGKLGARVNKPELKGDLLVVRAQFSINRSDFGIQAGQYTDKVSEEIQLTLALAGSAATE